MGALIQTKGTQRLARYFNDRFDKDSLPSSRLAQIRDPITSALGVTLCQAFDDATNDLLKISDLFIAQNATVGTAAANSPWPQDQNDLLYPSATMAATVAIAGSPTLSFRLPGGVNQIPGYIAPRAAVCSLDARKSIPHGLIVAPNGVSAIAGGAGGTFTVTLNGNVNNVGVGEKICFTKGKHEQLVRRWRWYLKYDMTAESHSMIRRAISTALDNQSFKKITFQTIEETQKVLTQIETQLDNDLEFDDTFLMHIILMTRQTTSPDPIDQQV